MKVTVDTAQDSAEDIKKAIRLLASLSGAKEVYTNYVPQKETADAAALGDFMNMVEAPERKETPGIEFY